MADRKVKNAEKGRGKGVAFSKWAKIDKAQRNMLVAVCVTSIVFGITVVGVIYAIRVLSFNATLIGEKESVISTYKTIQSNLDQMAADVDELKTNENLEVLARTRSADCASITAKDLEKAGISDLELSRTCSALRIIPDALPAGNNIEATLASMNKLLLEASNTIHIESLSADDVEMSEYEYSDDEESSDEEGEASIVPVGVSFMVSDSTETIHAALDAIERSVRNYDIASATISFKDASENADGVSVGPQIELTATYRAYYSNALTFEMKTKKVCADTANEKCKGKSSK
jgi:hypothetical protein